MMCPEEQNSVESVENNRMNTEKEKQIDLSCDLAPDNTTTNQRLFHHKRRRQLFCDDVIFESVQFLNLRDVIRINEMNRLVLERPFQLAINRLEIPRIIRPIKIDYQGIRRGFAGIRNEIFMERLPFPQIPPPPNKILGFGRITIALPFNYNIQFLEKVTNFLCLCYGFLRRHDLLLILSGWNVVVVIKDLVENIFSKLSGGFRMIQIDGQKDSMEGVETLFTTPVFRLTNRLHFRNYSDINLPVLENCVEWLHLPTSDKKSRTLILCTCYSSEDLVNKIISNVVKRFESRENNGKEAPPKFCFVFFTLTRVISERFKPFYLTNKECGDAISLNKFCVDLSSVSLPSDLEPPWWKLFSVNADIEKKPSIHGFIRRAFSDFQFQLDWHEKRVYGFILRRDVAIGPWTLIKLFEARRQDPFPEQHKLLEIGWFW